MMTLFWIFLGFFVLFLNGHWYVNIRKNSYENIFGAMLLIGLFGGILTGMVAFSRALMEIYQIIFG